MEGGDARLGGCRPFRGEPAGVRVRLTKRIPAQGGLGGGSSDGAAALVAFDAMWRRGLWMASAWKELARQLGRGRAVLPAPVARRSALGRGDEIQRLPDMPSRDVVLVFPPVRRIDAGGVRWFDEDAAFRTEPAQPAGRTVPLPGIDSLTIVNELQEPVSPPAPGDSRGVPGARGCGSGSGRDDRQRLDGVRLVPAGPRGGGGRRDFGRPGGETLLTATAGRGSTRPRP